MMSDGIDEATLSSIAELTEARYFRAADSKTLREVFEAIDTLEPSPAEVEELVHHSELYRIFLGPALWLLLLDLLLSMTVLRRWP